MIKLNHFSFSYIENRIILDDLTFHIQKGEKVGLIGCNGAGKSTLLKTIIGIEHGQGELKVTDLDMNNQNLATIRSHIGYVFQDSDNQLFMSSVYEDVAFGPLNEGLQGEELEERINNALDLVHMQERSMRRSIVYLVERKKELPLRQFFLCVLMFYYLMNLLFH